MEQALTFDRICPFVREAGLQRGDSWQIPRRIYDHEFLYCISGEAILTIGEDRYELTAGCLALIPPDTPHTLRYRAEEKAEICWLHFDFVPSSDGDWIYRWYNTPENYIRCFSERLPFPEHIRPVPVLPGGFRLPAVTAFAESDKLERVFLSLARMFSLEQDHFLLMSRVAILQILDLLLDRCGYWRHSEPVRVSDQMKQYIRFNYMKRISVLDIGGSTRYNADYAAKLFRQETGVSVIDYLNRYRVDKAQTMMLDESVTMADIADRCGFQSVNYFSTVVRKLTGKSPRELRAYLLTIKNDSIEEGRGHNVSFS